MAGGAADGDSDIDLLAAWKSGDRDKGNLLFERHFATVHRFFANKVGAERDAEDLIQRTFLACVEARDRYGGDASFRSYLLGIASNVLFGHYRHAVRHAGDIDVFALSLRDLGAGPSTLLKQQRDQHALLEALRTLPLHSQILLELYYWEGFTGAQIGEFFAIPEDTARSRLRKARKLLLQALHDFNGRAVHDEDDLDRWAAEIRTRAFEA